jgi:NDP-sugar pyrophosphorylase family protein
MKKKLISMPQNIISKTPLSTLGYNFIKDVFVPRGKDEYYLRNKQNRNGIIYRQLSAYEIEVLVRNGNTSDNWNRILVSDAFNPELVKNCKFYGLVRIGKLEPFCLGFSDLKAPVGLYNSTIISCDFGDNVVIDNVQYLSHYIIGSEVIIANVNELVTTNHAKFGNGIIKEGEEEDVRIWMEICNENTGRRVMPFNGMLAGDAFLWSRYKDDKILQEKLKTFTETRFDNKRGYYGKIGDRTVIKNCKIIKDVWVGTDAYFKGANKLKNLTVNSGAEGQTQIGEGCEIVNGIIGFGCRLFYGVKAVRFIMASHSQLKYGARLINSYLGHNATISCCEVLNSLIFPAHEQHHNNSFLCAALVMGQSNIAAGATIGSNHNSRSADGEIIMGRGFWPGLCVSLKHNSKFASFTILAKGDYPAELNIPFPFSLVSNEVSRDQLVIMPGTGSCTICMHWQGMPGNMLTVTNAQSVFNYWNTTTWHPIPLMKCSLRFN